MALHDADELTCPRCGQDLEGLSGAVPAGVEGDQIRVAVDCPGCDAALELVVEEALPDAVGLDVWVEDRRERGQDSA